MIQQREIKFRVWSKRRRIMSKVYELFDRFLVYDTPKEAIQSFGPEQDDAVMQYTGLKDYNKKEIYEGDIIKVTDELEEDTAKTGAVEWLNEFGIWYIEGELNEGLGDLHYNRYTEIIGNIYENANLLERVKQ